MSNPFADAFRTADTNDPATFRVGYVTSTSPLEVNIAGQDALSANRLASYTPATDDVVLILQNSSELVVLDRLVGGG